MCVLLTILHGEGGDMLRRFHACAAAVVGSHIECVVGERAELTYDDGRLIFINNAL